MTFAALLVVAAAGGVGAVLRLVVDTAVSARAARAFPLGTVVVNISGSFVIGLVSGATSASFLDPAVAAVVTTGLLGGYTTFSAASLDAVALVRAGRRRAAAVYAAVSLATSMIAAALGLGVALLLLVAR